MVRLFLLSMLALFCAGTASAAETVSLPSTGVDVGSYVDLLVATLGTNAGKAITAGFALFALWMGFRYIKSAIRGGK